MTVTSIGGVDQTKGRRLNKWRRWTAIVSLALLLGLFDRYYEFTERDLCGTRTGIAALLSEQAAGYQTLAAAGHRKPKPHFVTVVTFRHDHDPEDVLSNPCSQRLYIARLLKALQSATPSLIVLDKAFGAEACKDNVINQNLGETIRASQIPIVIGLETKTISDLRAIQGGTLTEPQKKGFEAACLYLTPAFRFQGGGSSSRITYGLMRMNRTLRKVPVRWPTYSSKESVGSTHPESLPTLGLAAVTLYDHTLTGKQRIEQLTGQDINPFTSFITNPNPSISAWDLICETPLSQTADWTSCAPKQNTDQGLSGRIVLIGDDVPERDQHETVELGTIAGVMLQANYIESLLDDRFLHPVPLILVVLVNATWLVIVEILFWKLDSPELAFVLALLATALLWSLCYLLTALTGYFLTLASPGLLYLLVRWGITRGHQWAKAA